MIFPRNGSVIDVVIFRLESDPSILRSEDATLDLRGLNPTNAHDAEFCIEHSLGVSTRSVLPSRLPVSPRSSLRNSERVAEGLKITSGWKSLLSPCRETTLRVSQRKDVNRSNLSAN